MSTLTLWPPQRRDSFSGCLRVPSGETSLSHSGSTLRYPQVTDTGFVIVIWQGAGPIRPVSRATGGGGVRMAARLPRATDEVAMEMLSGGEMIVRALETRVEYIFESSVELRSTFMMPSRQKKSHIFWCATSRQLPMRQTAMRAPPVSLVSSW